MKSVSFEEYNLFLKRNSNQFRIPDKPHQSLNCSSPTLFSTPNKHMGSSSSSPNLQETQTERRTRRSSGSKNSDEFSNSLDIPNSCVLWIVNPRPTNSEKYYNFTSFAMSLNEMEDNIKLYLPSTDSRLRPDIKCLEEGDLNGSSNEKQRLEEKQREVRKLKKKKNEVHKALWFDSKLNEFTQENEWIFNEKYWDRNFNESPDIF